MGIRHLTNNISNLPTPKPNGPRCSPMSCRSRRSRSFTIEATRIPARPPSLAPTPSDETRHTSYLLLYGHQFAILRVGLSRRLRSNQLLESRNLQKKNKSFRSCHYTLPDRTARRKIESYLATLTRSRTGLAPQHTHTHLSLRGRI